MINLDISLNYKPITKFTINSLLVWLAKDDHFFMQLSQKFLEYASC